MSETGNEFEAAGKVAEHLKPFERESQQRILRWVAESLDLALHVRAPKQDTTPDNAAGAQRSTESDDGDGGHVQARAERHSGVTDIRTFVEGKRPKSDVQFATVVAYFYQFQAPEGQRRDTLDSDGLVNATRLVNWQRLSNPLVTLNNAKAQGYLDSPSRGQFAVSSVGENLVAMTLPNGEVAPQSRKPKAKPSKPKTGKGAKKAARKK